MHHCQIQYNTPQCPSVQHNSLHYSTTLKAIQHSTALQYSVTQSNSLQHFTTLYNTLQLNPILYNTLQHLQADNPTPPPHLSVTLALLSVCNSLGIQDMVPGQIYFQKLDFIAVINARFARPNYPGIKQLKKSTICKISVKK